MTCPHGKHGQMKKYFFDNVIVGSGCAAYNAADILAGAGKETAVVTEGKNIGTSRNAGSADPQPVRG